MFKFSCASTKNKLESNPMENRNPLNDNSQGVDYLIGKHSLKEISQNKKEKEKDNSSSKITSSDFIKTKQTGKGSNRVFRETNNPVSRKSDSF
jgi:hypothetical protein